MAVLKKEGATVRPPQVIRYAGRRNRELAAIGSLARLRFT
jgi:hypothetical protein